MLTAHDPEDLDRSQKAKRAAGLARLRAGERPAFVAKIIKVHPQTVYGWFRAERAKKYALLSSLVELSAGLQGWLGDPRDVPVLLLRRNRLRAGLEELRGNLL